MISSPNDDVLTSVTPLHLARDVVRDRLVPACILQTAHEGHCATSHACSILGEKWMCSRRKVSVPKATSKRSNVAAHAWTDRHVHARAHRAKGGLSSCAIAPSARHMNAFTPIADKRSSMCVAVNGARVDARRSTVLVQTRRTTTVRNCQYPGRDSNSYNCRQLEDFESSASTDSATRAGGANKLRVSEDAR
jgi:hypothetical protein